MWEYLQINLTIFCLAALALAALRKAPARSRLYISVVGMLVWLVPWQALNIQLPTSLIEPLRVFKVYDLQDVTRIFDSGDSDYQATLMYETLTEKTEVSTPDAVAAPVTVTATKSWFQPVYLEILFFAALIFGALLVVIDTIKYRRTLNAWYRKSRRADSLKQYVDIDCRPYSVRYLDGFGPGMTTGVFKPVVWIDSRAKDASTLRSILVHEINHIKSYDSFWVALVHTVHTLFWWNPIVTFFYRHARNDIEISCDERSVQAMEGKVYIRSLAKLLLSEQKPKMGVAISGNLTGKVNFNLRRIQLLQTVRMFSFMHLAYLIAFVAAVVMVCLTFSYDEKLRDFAPETDEFVVVQNNRVVVEYDHSDKNLYGFMQLLYQGRHQQAAGQVEAFKKLTLFGDVKNRIKAFNVLAAYYGDINQYEQIPVLLREYALDLKNHDHWEVYRTMIITHIKLQQYEQAIEQVHKSGALNYRGYRFKLLMAQAYHLMGDYEQSNAVINKALTWKPMRVDRRHRMSMLRLKGKNLVMLGETAGLEDIRTQLGKWAPADFSDISADKQRIPYPYFLHKKIAGEQVSGFDVDRFPLKKAISDLQNPDAQEFYRQAIRYANQGKYFKARSFIEESIPALTAKPGVSDKEVTQILEYLFVLNLRLGDEKALADLSQKIVDRPDLTVDIRARAYWALAAGKRRYTDAGVQSFKNYVDLFPQPTLALDHEIITRVWKTRQFPEAKTALVRVIRYYERMQITPDIRTLNRIISMLERLGDTERAEKYEKMFAQHYDRAVDFSLEDWAN